MGRDYLPEGDKALVDWARGFITRLTEELDTFGLTEADIAELTAAGPEFAQASIECREAQTLAKSLCSAKKDKRAVLIRQIRTTAARIQGHPKMTNAQRTKLGLPRRGVTSSPGNPSTSKDRPVAVVNIQQPLRHTLRIQNQDNEDISQGKPEGARAVEVWVRVGDIPADVSEMRYVDTPTKNLLSVSFRPEDGNKQAHYKMRWVYRNGQKGNWSALQSATIAA